MATKMTCRFCGSLISFPISRKAILCCSKARLLAERIRNDADSKLSKGVIDKPVKQGQEFIPWGVSTHRKII